MFKKKKQNPQINQEQLALIENAQHRIKQKKRLYTHFVLFVIGSALLIFLNVVLKVGEEFIPFNKPWFLPAILIWLTLFLYHIINVFIINKYMGKDWEKTQLDKLVTQQKVRIEKIKTELKKEAPHIAESEIYNEELALNKANNLTLIVAAGENNEIGKDNDLIWHLRDDLKRFKALTSGHHIIMGRKTFESFPKPLPNRTHIVITRQKNYQAPEGVIVVNSLEDAINAAKKDHQPFIIGGGEIYKQAIALDSKIEITRVHSTFDADTFFPEIDTQLWEETENNFHKKDNYHDHEFSFITYRKS